jgi:regulator of ribonuclease activity A
MNIGFSALNISPVNNVKRNSRDIDIPVKFGGITFISDHYIYIDGILVSKRNLVK